MQSILYHLSTKKGVKLDLFSTLCSSLYYVIHIRKIIIKLIPKSCAENYVTCVPCGTILVLTIYGRKHTQTINEDKKNM
jgi:hypothetical protein